MIFLTGFHRNEFDRLSFVSSFGLFAALGIGVGNAIAQIRGYHSLEMNADSFGVDLVLRRNNFVQHTLYEVIRPTGSGWWHWVVFDIPANVNELAEGAGDPAKNLAPKGSVQSVTDFGKPGYGGPCPPEGHGFHQYIITVYALKTDKLGLDKNASPAMVGYYLNANTIAKASLVFYYKR